MSVTHDHPHIDEVEPIGDDDLVCLNEVREVLRKHGKVERFGVQLLHRHFDVAEDEIFVEDVSTSDRTLTQRVIKIDEVQLASGEGLMTTAIDLIEEPVIRAAPAPRSNNCRYTFPPGPNPGHQHVEIYN